ncbi:MAG TPA: nuclear transport factor 2 family protein [Solirubrobacteraceae bacterium]|jgi:ketosteroid isomerase-like protein|nr:nuclear transport factor 2 family protein [Solirubrobacteraceae bacterium]
MSQADVELIRHVFEVFNSEDIEEIVSLVDTELEVQVPSEVSAEPDTYRGKEGIRQYFRSFQDVMDEIRFEPERLHDTGQSVVVALLLTAKGRQTAIAVEQRTGAVWTFRNGKVLRVQTYASWTDALRAAGVAE